MYIITLFILMDISFWFDIINSDSCCGISSGSSLFAKVPFYMGVYVCLSLTSHQQLRSYGDGSFTAVQYTKGTIGKVFK